MSISSPSQLYDGSSLFLSVMNKLWNSSGKDFRGLDLSILLY